MIRSKWVNSVAFAGLVLAAVNLPTARASFIATDPFSIPVFTGSEPFVGTGIAGTIDATVDYAVFAPGTFPGPAGGGNMSGIDNVFGGSPTDLTGIPQYVYVYLVNNLSDSTLAINLFSLGLANGAVALNAGNNTSLAGTAPFFQSVPPSSPNAFINLFSGLPAGASSDVVMFTSPQPPTFDSATLGNGGVNAQAVLPSPAVPEPATGALMVAGGSLVALRRRRRARD